MEMSNPVTSPSFSPSSPLFKQSKTYLDNKKALDVIKSDINGILKNNKFSEELINQINISENILEEILEFVVHYPKFDYQTSIINSGISKIKNLEWDIRLMLINNSDNESDILRDFIQSNNDLSLKFEELKSKNNTHWTGSRIKMFRGIGIFNSFFTKYHLDLKYENVRPLTGNKIRKDSNVVKKLYDGKIVAEKNIGKSLYKKQDKLLLQNEIIRMRSFQDCDNIQQIYGYTHQGSCYYLISNWADYNLQTYLKKNHNIDWSTKLNIASGIANALCFCHERDILHRNIKSANVMLDKDLNPILYNFGTYESYSFIFKPVNHEKDDPRWTAPELLCKKKNEHSTESEVYSFSILLWEIATQKEPFGGCGDIKSEFLRNKIITDHKRPELESMTGMWNKCNEYFNIMKQGWNSDPNKRPTMIEMQSQFFALEKLYIKGESVENVFESFSSSSSSIYSHSSRASSIASVDDNFQLLLSPDGDDYRNLLSSKLRSISAPQKLGDNHQIHSDCADFDFDGNTLNEDAGSRLRNCSFTTFGSITDTDDEQTIEEQEVIEQKDIEEEEEAIEQRFIEQQQPKSPNSLLTQAKSIFSRLEPNLEDANKFYKQKDYKKALKIFKEYEKISHTAKSKRLVGLCYLKSKPTNKNKAHAAEYLDEASKGGDRVAQYEYAMAIHNNKIQIEMRERYAFIKGLLNDSAKQNYAPAIAKVGQFINSGDCNFKKDPDEAKSYQDRSRKLKREYKINKSNNNKLSNQSRIPARQHTKNSLSLTIDISNTTKSQKQQTHKKFNSELTLPLSMSRSRSNGSFV